MMLVFTWRVLALTGLRRSACLFHLGNALYARGRRDQAIASWAGAVAADPGHVGAWNNQANALLEAERLAEAAAAFARLGALSGDAAPWYLAGKCRHRLGERALAKAAFTNCIAGDPDHVGALEHLGRIALAERDGTAAVALLRRALARAEQQAGLHFCLAAACELIADRDAAREHYRLAGADAALRPQAEQRLRRLDKRRATTGSANDA